MNGLDQFTIPQLETAAADLRNAALVVEHTGHTKGSLLNHDEGTVCAAGAIDLATFRRLAYITTPLSRYLVLESHDGNCRDAEHNRAEIAYAVLADFLPAELCEGCDYGRICDCPSHYGTPHLLHEGVTSWEKVTHYNDAHCSGGQLLANMLRIGADRAELAIYDRQRMLTGAVLTA